MPRKLLGVLPIAGQQSQAGALALGVWLACSPGSRREPSRQALVASLARESAVTGTRTAASLQRLERPSGGEILIGETHFELEGAIRAVHVRESAEVDANGRLLIAEVGLSYVARGSAVLPKHLAERVTFDGVNHFVRVSLVGGEVAGRHVEGDFPWIYQPVSLPSGKTLGTPVAVSVARAAARAGNFARRVAAFGADESVSCDQFAVPGASGDWVVLGDDLATFSRDTRGHSELTTLRLAALGLELRSSETLRAPLG